MNHPKIIGISGLAGAGKDTVAAIIASELPSTVRMSFADPLKEFAQEVFDFSNDQIWGPSEFRNAPDPRYVRPNGEPLTPRFALQTLGTEWGRNCCEDVWARYAMRRAGKVLAFQPGPVVFADCRFVNEARAIREAGGEVWRVARPGAGLDGAAGLHPSEQEQTSNTFKNLVSHWITNDTDFGKLRIAIKTLLFRVSNSDSAGPLADLPQGSDEH